MTDPGAGEEDALERAGRREEMIDRLAAWVQARGLAGPAALLIEVCKPLSILGSQALFLCQPVLGGLGQFFGWMDGDRVVAEYAALLEDPANVDRLLARLEDRAAE